MGREHQGRTSWRGVTALLYGTTCCAGLNEGLDALRRGDYTAAARELKPLAAKGDSEAQYRLGLMYEFGNGFPQDNTAAVGWLKRYATTGNASAQQELGVMYTYGDGVPKDDAQAIAWFRKAAEQDLPVAQFALGVAYEYGEGVAADPVAAYANYSIAARSGNPDAAAHRADVGARLSSCSVQAAAGPARRRRR